MPADEVADADEFAELDCANAPLRRTRKTERNCICIVRVLKKASRRRKRCALFKESVTTFVVAGSSDKSAAEGPTKQRYLLRKLRASTLQLI